MKRTFKIQGKNSFKFCIEHIKERAPGPLKVTVDDWSDNRSAALNRLMWYWYGQVKKMLFETRGIHVKSEDIHDELVELLLPLEYRTGINGEQIAQRARTSKMTNKELCGYLELLEHHCVEWLNMTGEYALINPEDLKYRGEK